MTFNKFTKEYLEALKQEGVDIETRKIVKENEQLTGIYLKNVTKGILVTDYLEYIYESYESGTPMDQLVWYTVRILKQVDMTIYGISDFFTGNEKQNLYCTVMNKKQNECLIANIPHQDFYDLTLIARLKIFENVSIIVDSNICDLLRISFDDVMKIAKDNTYAEGYIIRRLPDVINELQFMKGKAFEIVDSINMVCNKKMPFFVLTNKYYLYGATMMTCKAVLEDIFLKLGENFYILPSSLHEVILITESFTDDVYFLKDIVMEMNAIVQTEEWLSESVYHYDGNTRMLTIVGKKNI